MVNFTTKISTTIKDIDPQTWQKFFGSHIQRKYGYYQTAEDPGFDKFKLFYLQIFQDEKLVAICPMFVTDFPLGFSLKGNLKNISNFINKYLYYLTNIRTVLVGSVSSCKSDIGVDPDVKDREPILIKTIEEMHKLARKEKALLVAFKDFPCAYSQFLQKNGFTELETYPNVVLDINFNSFDEYFKTLSPATRHDIRRKFKKYSELPQLSFEVKKDCNDCLDRIYELYMNVVNKNEVSLEIAKKQYFVNISKYMPDEVNFLIWKLGDKIVSFSLFFKSGDLVVADNIGLDYDFAYKYNLYFITFKDKIEWCVKNNIKRFDDGTFTFDPKKRLKFNFYKNFFYMKPRWGILSPIFRFFSSFFKPEKTDDQLKFLKKFNKI